MNRRPPTSEHNFELNIDDGGDDDDGDDGGGHDGGDDGGDDVLVPTLRVARHSLKEEKNGCEEIKTTEVSDWFLDLKYREFTIHFGHKKVSKSNE